MLILSSEILTWGLMDGLQKYHGVFRCLENYVYLSTCAFFLELYSLFFFSFSKQFFSQKTTLDSPPVFLEKCYSGLICIHFYFYECLHSYIGEQNNNFYYLWNLEI